MTSVIVSHDAANALVAHVLRSMRATLARHETFSIALPGGSVATSCFPLLAKAELDWPRVHLLWGDERAVPPDHADSNYGVAKRLLIDACPIPIANVHRMPADEPDLDGAARDHEEVVRAIRLDLALLGVGPDGHVCSLFPGHALLNEHERWVRAIEDSPKPPPSRLTLTLPALANAREIVVVATGASKAAVVREALEDETSLLPLALAIRCAKTATVILDEGAASSLTAR
ncbi:MAG: 6-phosphogluconolactonase [Deltaproteobacteria bacterium]|nr:6-phosphogluconolactonase [Deltaproteobacteria bacterium]